MKNSLSQSVFLVVVFILFSPHESQADAINPIFNLFTPDTVVPASILTVMIILLETLLLWKWIKPISFRLSLWRATVINIISSAAGSIAAWLFFQEQMIWGMMGLYIPMFFLTLATETPTLKFLYRQSGLDWERSIKVSFGLNFFSYLFVFIAQFVLIFAYVVGYANFADKQTIRKWNDVSLLEGETGFIYTVKDAHTENFTKYVFNRYDVENKKWEIVDPGFERGIYPAVWDAKGNLIACIIETGEWKNRPIAVINATTFLKLAEIDGNFREARISPDLSKLAVFDYVREINAPRDDKSAFMLGSGCKLKIYDIESGSLLHEAPRLALDMGLTWTNNSTIIFTSLREESLLKNSEADTPRQKYGRGYAKPGQFPIDLFIYDLRTNSVGSLFEGQRPQFIPSNNEISFVRESGSYNREIWQTSIEKKNPRLVLGDIQGYETAVSPSGRKYLILIPHKQPLVSSYFLTLVDPNDQGRKLIIEPNSHYGFRWIGSQIMTKALAKPTSEHRQLDNEVIRPINHDPGPSRSDGPVPQSRFKQQQPNPDSESFLQACRKGDIETVKRLLDRDIDLNPLSKTRKVALVEAAKGQHIEIMNLLLEKGADINLLDSSEKSALMTASESGSLAAVRFLIKKGADVNIEDNMGQTAVAVAANDDIRNILKKYGAAEKWEDLILKSREFLRRGKYSNAAYSAQEALKVAEKKFGPNHPNVSKALSNLADIYVAQGEYLKADQHCQRCIKINENVFGKDHLKVAEALTCLSFVYQAQGKYEEAEQLSLRIFETRKDGFWKDYTQLAPNLGAFFENCNEPSIYYFRNQPDVECYRFTHISHSPGGRQSFVRIIKNKSSIKLYTGYRNPYAKNPSWRLASRELKEEEWKTLTDAISNRAFWDLSYWDPIKGIDGGYTILEGVNKGRYHLVIRWSPQSRTSERGLNEFRHATGLFPKLLEIK